MDSGLHTIVEFDENNKWFVLAEKIIDGIKYSYMVRVNKNEDDFIDEYIIVRSYFKNSEEYMDLVKGDELKKVVPILIPEAKEYVENPEKLRHLLSEGTV